MPTPKAVLGDVAGAPGKLPYSAEVYRYMRMLEKASPRVKVFTIGTTEEGREMIAVAVASEQLLAQLDENRARLAKLADPRTIKMNDAEADKLVAASISDLLHHRHHPLHRNRLAHRADGTGLSPRGRRERLHQGDPRQRDHADHSRGGSRWARPHGGHLQLAPRASRAKTGRR